MALSIKLAENGHSPSVAATGRDRISLKVESENVVPERNPVVFSVATRLVLALDIGRYLSKINISGVVDEEVTELFVDTKAGNPFQVGETITGTAGLNASTTPVRGTGKTSLLAANANAGQRVVEVANGNLFYVGETVTVSDATPDTESATISTINDYELTMTANLANTYTTAQAAVVTGQTPTAVVVAGIPSLSAPTSLIISGLVSGAEFFVDNETITGGTSGGTATVNEPLASKIRLEQLAAYAYSNGVLTLESSSGVYRVYFRGLNFTREAGKAGRYSFKIDFVQGKT